MNKPRLTRIEQTETASGLEVDFYPQRQEGQRAMVVTLLYTTSVQFRGVFIGDSLWTLDEAETYANTILMAVRMARQGYPPGMEWGDKTPW